MGRSIPWSFTVVLLAISVLAAWSIRTAGDRAPLAAGVVWRTVRSGGGRFDVVQVDLDRAEVHVCWSPVAPAQTLRAAEQAERAAGRRRPVFATNAGIFDKQHVPLGLTMENGRVLRPINRSNGIGNFFLPPGGVFVIDGTGHAAILPITRVADPPPFTLATQSGPLLLTDRQINPIFGSDSPNRTIRSGVGVIDGRHMVFACSREPVTFAEFARLFRDELTCTDALYLDGTISRFDFPTREVSDETHDFAGVICVSQRVDQSKK